MKAHPMSDSAKRGRDLFFSEKANCTACHVGANLTDEKYHNLGVGMDKEKPDIGREDATKEPRTAARSRRPRSATWRCRRPTCTTAARRRWKKSSSGMPRGGIRIRSSTTKIKKLDLTDQDKKDLVEFMKRAAGSDFPKVERGRLPE